MPSLFDLAGEKFLARLSSLASSLAELFIPRGLAPRPRSCSEWSRPHSVRAGGLQRLGHLAQQALGLGVHPRPWGSLRTLAPGYPRLLHPAPGRCRGEACETPAPSSSAAVTPESSFPKLDVTRPWQWPGRPGLGVDSVDLGEHLGRDSHFPFT